MKTEKPVQKTEQTPLEKIIKEEQIGRTKQVETKIEEYEKLIAGLPDLLLGYGIQVKELCSNVGMARGTFYNRVARLDFSPGDLRQVYKYIENAPRTHKNAPETPETPQNTQSPYPNTENATEAPEQPVNPPITIASPIIAPEQAPEQPVNPPNEENKAPAASEPEKRPKLLPKPDFSQYGLRPLEEQTPAPEPKQPPKSQIRQIVLPKKRSDDQS
jgi:hypothetical protein